MRPWNGRSTAPRGQARRSALQRVRSQRVVAVTEPKPAVVTATDLFLLGFISLLSFCGFCFFDSLGKRQILSCVNRPRCSGLTRGSCCDGHQTNCDFPEAASARFLATERRFQLAAST